jgi:hypothetical protein
MRDVIEGAETEGELDLLGEPSCPACGASVPEDSIFCKQCGAQLVCRHCHAPVHVGARFCGSCGNPLGGGA